MKRSTDINADEQTSAFLTFVRWCDIGFIIAGFIAVIWLDVATFIIIYRRSGWLICSMFVAGEVVFLSLAYYAFFRSRLKFETIQKEEE